MTRVLLIGVAGTVGAAVHATLAREGFDLVTADLTPGRADHLIDVTDRDSIRLVYEAAGEVDAVAITVGDLALAPLNELTRAHVDASVAGKLLSQIDIVLAGLGSVRPRGSFTLVSGIMSRIPWRGGVTAAIANGGIDAFVIAAAAELGADRRINAVSPSILEESILKYGGTNPLPGHTPISAELVAQTYLRSIAGIETGKTFTVGY